MEGTRLTRSTFCEAAADGRGSKSSLALSADERLRRLGSSALHEEQRRLLKEAYGKLRRFQPEAFATDPSRETRSLLDSSNEGRVGTREAPLPKRFPSSTSPPSETDAKGSEATPSSPLDLDAIPVAAGKTLANFEEMVEAALDAEETRRREASLDRQKPRPQQQPRPFLKKGASLQAWRAASVRPSRQTHFQTPSSRREETPSPAVLSTPEEEGQMTLRELEAEDTQQTRDAPAAPEDRRRVPESVDILADFAALALDGRCRAEQKPEKRDLNRGGEGMLHWSSRIFEDASETSPRRERDEEEVEEEERVASESEDEWLSTQLREETKKASTNVLEAPHAMKAKTDSKAEAKAYDEEFPHRRLISFADEQETPQTDSGSLPGKPKSPTETSSSATASAATDATADEERRRIKNKMEMLKQQLGRLRDSEQRLRNISSDLKKQRDELDAERGKMRADLNREHQRSMEEIRACRQQLLLEKRRVATEQERLRAGLAEHQQQQQQLVEMQSQVANLQEELRALRQKNRADQNRWRAERRLLQEQLLEAREELRVATLRNSSRSRRVTGRPLQSGEAGNEGGDSLDRNRGASPVSSQRATRQCSRRRLCSRSACSNRSRSDSDFSGSSFASSAESKPSVSARHRRSNREGGNLQRRRDSCASRDAVSLSGMAALGPANPSTEWPAIAGEVLRGEEHSDARLSGRGGRRNPKVSHRPHHQQRRSASPSVKEENANQQPLASAGPALAALTTQLLQTLQQQQRLLLMHQQQAFQATGPASSLSQPLPLPSFVSPADSFGHSSAASSAALLTNAAFHSALEGMATATLTREDRSGAFPANREANREGQQGPVAGGGRLERTNSLLPPQDSTTTGASQSASASESTRTVEDLPGASSAASAKDPRRLPSQNLSLEAAAAKSTRAEAAAEGPQTRLSDLVFKKAREGTRLGAALPFDEQFAFLLKFDFFGPFASLMEAMQRMIKEGGPPIHSRELKERTESVYRSGYSRVVYSNGLEKLRSAAGVVYVLFGNGDVKINDLDGTQIYRFKESDTLQYTLKDNTVLNRFSDGQVECQHPDGSAEIVFSNGVRKCLHKDKRETIIFPDGSVQEGAAPAEAVPSVKDARPGLVVR